MPFYGAKVTDRTIHVHPHCPMLRKKAKDRSWIIDSFTTEADAIIDGHTKRCLVCFELMLFTIRIGKEQKTFLISVDEAKFLVELVNRIGDKKFTNEDMSASTGASVRMIQEYGRRMKRYGLSRTSAIGSRFGSRPVRRPTEWGRAVAICYTMGIYSIPNKTMLEDARKAGEYTKLI